MLMRGDVQALINEINPIFEKSFNMIDALGARVDELERQVKILQQAPEAPKRGPGRPKKNPD